MNEQQTYPKRLIRIKEVITITGLSKSSVYDRMKAGQFPKSVSIGGQSVAWVESEVIEWVDSQISLRDEVA